jgi:hypothetical protein
MSIILSPQVSGAFPPVEKVRAYPGREGFIDFPVWLDVISMIVSRAVGHVLYTPFHDESRYQHGKFKSRFIQWSVTKAVTIPTELALIPNWVAPPGFSLFNHGANIIGVAVVLYPIQYDKCGRSHRQESWFTPGLEINI